MRFIREHVDQNKQIINNIRESATILKVPNSARATSPTASTLNPPMTPPLSDRESEAIISKSSLTARPTSLVNNGTEYRSLLLTSPRKQAQFDSITQHLNKFQKNRLLVMQSLSPSSS
jgi:hypothetical protein